MSDLSLKCIKFDFPRPRCGSLQRSPDPLAGIKGAASWHGGEQEGMEKGRGKGWGEWREEGRERKGRDGAGKEKGDRGNGRDGRGHGMGREGRETRKGREKEEGCYSPKLHFLALPLLI